MDDERISFVEETYLTQPLAEGLGYSQWDLTTEGKDSLTTEDENEDILII